MKILQVIKKAAADTKLIQVILALSVIMWLAGPELAESGTYLSSAHGNSTTGVDREAVTGGAYPNATNEYPVGHCGHCHDQHASIDGSEPTLPTAQGPSSYALFSDNYGADTNEFCYDCHDTFTLGGMTLTYGRYGIYQGSTKFNASIHYTDADMDWGVDASPPGPPFSPTSSLVDPGNCHNCHNPHGYDDGGGVVPSMLFARDSKSGDSPELEMGCEACHDGSQGGATKDVETQLGKTYAHPTHTYNDRHTLPESGSASFGPSNRHAECVDCHNPHTVVSGTNHTAGAGASGNAVSDVLKYVWGVEPSWTTIWTQPTVFTERKPPTYVDGAQYEYQICFKCHSRYGLGADSDGTANDGIYPSITPETAGNTVTDQAMEFNKNNKSVHPVVVGLSSQTGSDSPEALDTTQVTAIWSGVGTETMYCSDCHGANDEATAANGPHGSSNKHILKGVATASATYWPLNPAGDLWALNNLGSGETRYRSTWRNELFCVNCHPMCSGSCDNDNDYDNEAHGEHWDRNDDFPGNDARCVACHVAIPHGSKRSRLIGYASDPAPYDYNNNSNVIRGYKKAADPTDYDEDDCWTSISCDNTHPNAGGYDP